MFLDTSGLFCFFDNIDHRHAHAVRLLQSADILICQSLVLAELIPLCQARGLNRNKTLEFAEDLLNSPLIEIVWVDEILHRAAQDLLTRRLDKTYSLCDAASFILMKERGIQEALTTDKHFEQEGFRRLLTN